MPSPLLGTLFITLALLSVSALAETPIERDLNRIRDEHQKAVAAALEPVNRRTQAALEMLLRQAMQANDLDGAVKVRAELRKLQDPAAAPPADQPLTANLPAPVTEDMLVQRPWVFEMPQNYKNTLTFSRDKTWSSTNGLKGTWSIKEKTLRVESTRFWNEFPLSGEATKEGLRLAEVNSNSGKRAGVTLTQVGK